MVKTGKKLKHDLAEARRLYDQGAWEAAGAAYQSIVHEQPGCGEAWFWLGGLCLQIGDPESAVTFLEQARAVGLTDPACLSNLGEAYRRQGNIEAALEVLKLACQKNDSYGAWFNLAVVQADRGLFVDALLCLEHLQPHYPRDVRLLAMKGEVHKNLKQLEKAATCFRDVLELEPKHRDAQLGLADTLRFQRKYQEAMGGYEAVLQLDPDNIAAFNGLAAVAVGLEDEKGAEAFYRQALARSPDAWESLIGLGMELTSRRRFDAAIEVLEHAVKVHGDKVDAWMRLGEAYFHSEHFEAALRSYQSALERNPNHVSSLVGVGNVYVYQERWADAIPLYKRAAELAPGDYRVLSNLAQAVVTVGNYEEATVWAQQAVDQAGETPDLPVRFNLAAIDLICGNLERGWQGYDSRASMVKMGKRFSHPYWQGESLADKRILIWQDQGIGDQLLFTTIFDEVIAQAREVVLECEPKLLSLNRRSFPKAIVVPRSNPPHPLATQPFDFQSAAGSLPRWLRPTPAHFPAKREPFLRLDADRSAYWQARIADLSDLPKIGVCWRSSLRTGLRNHCYAELLDWVDVFCLHGVTLVNLQYDECQAELAEIRDQHGANLVTFPELDMYNDLDETTAMIAQLDAVISAPTAVSRQAGAAGVPAYLLTVLGDWTSVGQPLDPWMPHVVKYRKHPSEPWADPISRMLADVRTRFGLN